MHTNSVIQSRNLKNIFQKKIIAVIKQLLQYERIIDRLTVHTLIDMKI